MKKAFSRPVPDLEKSWNLKESQNHGKIMEFQNIYMDTLFRLLYNCYSIYHKIIVGWLLCALKGVQGGHSQYTQKWFTSVKVARQSWNNDARVLRNHGKIMEFDSGKALGTLPKRGSLTHVLFVISMGLRAAELPIDLPNKGSSIKYGNVWSTL